MNKPQVNQPNPRPQQKNHRAENKDNLDSRGSEEFDYKGDDITHNKKEHHSEGKKKNG